MVITAMNDWLSKAKDNIEKWGMQDIPTLLLAMTEELGELAQAYLQYKHEHQPKKRIEKELADLAALCCQLQWRIEEEGEPR